MGHHAYSYAGGDTRGLVLFTHGIGHGMLNARLGQCARNSLGQFHGIGFVKLLGNNGIEIGQWQGANVRHAIRLHL